MKYERFEIWEDSRERLESSLAGIGVSAWRRRSGLLSEGAYVFITGRRQDELDKAVATLIEPLPTKWRASTRGPDRRPILEMLMISIDISDVRFET
jgi:hypothetical protein